MIATASLVLTFGTPQGVPAKSMFWLTLS